MSVRQIEPLAGTQYGTSAGQTVCSVTRTQPADICHQWLRDDRAQQTSREAVGWRHSSQLAGQAVEAQCRLHTGNIFFGTGNRTCIKHFIFCVHYKDCPIISVS